VALLELLAMIRNYGSGIDDESSTLQPLLDDPETLKAFGILRRGQR